MIERATLYAMASRLWGSAAGLLTAVLVAWFFTPELQGYYFTFLSLLTLQTFAELGFGELLQQFVSHEWAKTTSADSSERERSLSRLAALFRSRFAGTGCGSPSLRGSWDRPEAFTSGHFPMTGRSWELACGSRSR
jgi:hypothetical protein